MLIFAESFGAHSSDESAVQNDDWTISGADLVSLPNAGSGRGLACNASADSALLWLGGSFGPTVFLSFLFRYDAKPTGESVWLNLRYASGSNHLGLRITPANEAIQILGNGMATQIAVGTTPLIVGMQYRILLKVVIGQATAGSVALYLDGRLEASASGVDTAGSDTLTVSHLFFYRGNGHSFTFGDLVVWDNTGSRLNDVVHGLKVYPRRPNGAGNSAQWTPSAGSNYQNVNEMDTDGDTSYNETLNPTDKDTFAIEDLASDLEVWAVHTKIRARRTDALTRQLREVCRASGADYPGSNTTNLGDTYRHVHQVRDQNPAGGNWTPANFNAAEFGYELVA